MDNVFIERLWRSLKYECVYIHAFETGSELKAALAGGSPITTPSARTRALRGELRSRTIGGSGIQITGGKPPMI
jgi:putative transposase